MTEGGKMDSLDKFLDSVVNLGKKFKWTVKNERTSGEILGLINDKFNENTNILTVLFTDRRFTPAFIFVHVKQKFVSSKI